MILIWTNFNAQLFIYCNFSKVAEVNFRFFFPRSLIVPREESSSRRIEN